ncbi:Probable fatty acyl CoA thioesterase type III FcoT [Mycobacteroides abscessus subsp. abscessus]|nr:Probable fatty acyl CoA thioesterase type III FcoT [Mycobacteroides abscessus subsp. abscessus]
MHRETLRSTSPRTSGAPGTSTPWNWCCWSIDDYCENQLASMLIKSTSSRFRRLVNPRQFSARLQARDFHIVDRSWRYLQFHSTIEFWDQDGGSAAGEFDIAVLNIP